jgi:hypothetical protein
MRRNFIIRKRFPLREKKGRDFLALCKESDVLEEGLRILQVRGDDQQGSSCLLSPVR